jgi:hypothetical protein
VAFLSVDLGPHANFADVLSQFGLGSLEVYLQELLGVATLPGRS